MRLILLKHVSTDECNYTLTIPFEAKDVTTAYVQLQSLITAKMQEYKDFNIAHNAWLNSLKNRSRDRADDPIPTLPESPVDYITYNGVQFDYNWLLNDSVELSNGQTYNTFDSDCILTLDEWYASFKKAGD